MATIFHADAAIRIVRYHVDSARLRKAIPGAATGGIVALAAAVWPGAALGAGSSCAEWLAFSRAERIAAMNAFLHRSMPSSVAVTTLDCLRSIQHQIADHATDLCKRDGGDFVPSASTAIATAIEYCEKR
jgi:hypothetical protein